MTVSRDDLARELFEHSLENRTLAESAAPELARGVHVAVYGAGRVGRRGRRSCSRRAAWWSIA